MPAGAHRPAGDDVRTRIPATGWRCTMIHDQGPLPRKPMPYCASNSSAYVERRRGSFIQLSPAPVESFPGRRKRHPAGAEDPGRSNRVPNSPRRSGLGWRRIGMRHGTRGLPWFGLAGGGGEIRTHERLPFAGFQDQCNRPLCHTSSARLPQASASVRPTARALRRQAAIIAWHGAGIPDLDSQQCVETFARLD